MVSELEKDLQRLIASWKVRQINQGCSTFMVHQEHAAELQTVIERHEQNGPTVVIHQWV